MKIAGRFFATAGARLDRHTRSGTAVTYRIAPAYFLEATGTRFKATLGTGFKSPSLYQLYAPGTFWGPIGNERLKPEESRGWDAGIEQYLLRELSRPGSPISATISATSSISISAWATSISAGLDERLGTLGRSPSRGESPRQRVLHAPGSPGSGFGERSAPAADGQVHCPGRTGTFQQRGAPASLRFIRGNERTRISRDGPSVS